MRERLKRVPPDIERENGALLILGKDIPRCQLTIIASRASNPVKWDRAGDHGTVRVQEPLVMAPGVFGGEDHSRNVAKGLAIVVAEIVEDDRQVDHLHKSAAVKEACAKKLWHS